MVFQQPVFLMVTVLALSLYMGMNWLAWLIGVVGLLMIVSQMELGKAPEPVPQGSAQEEEEILTPVIVRDTGEAPYLYPPDFRIKIKPNWYAPNFIEEGAGAIGKTVNFAKHLVFGRKFK